MHELMSELGKRKFRKPKNRVLTPEDDGELRKSELLSPLPGIYGGAGMLHSNTDSVFGQRVPQSPMFAYEFYQRLMDGLVVMQKPFVRGVGYDNSIFEYREGWIPQLSWNYHSWADQVLWFEECAKMHFTPEGKKAKELLKSFVAERYHKDIDTKHSFVFNVHIRTEGQEELIDWSKTVWKFQANLYPQPGLILRNRWLPLEQCWASKLVRNFVPPHFCWHPEEVIPPGDLILSYWLQIFATESGVVGLLDQANW